MNNKSFATHLSAYFLKYMPTRTGYSCNTIQSYRDTFVVFLRYGKNVLKIKPDKMNFESINRKMVEDFLSWLEYQKKLSISTVNLRLAALHAFFRYVQLESPEYIELCSSILAIKSKKNQSQK
jgi:site-specific recombinase XerD